MAENREVRRFLYNARPQRTGAEEKENGYGTDTKVFESDGH